MTLLMAYCVLVSSAAAALATIADHLLRSRRLARRGLWLAAMALVVPVTGFVMLAPRAIEPTVGAVAVLELPLVSPDVPVIVNSATVSWLEASDVALTAGWLAASLLLFAAILFGRWRVLNEKRRARAGRVQGHDVLLTEDLGPAVAGVRNPVVFVPRWVIALDDASQRLLLAHEAEHIRRRDTGVLMAGAALTALVPWNPVAWWMARRLRIAVELDCDSRVLAAHPDVRRYADLLLIAAGKPTFTSRFLAAHFGEHASDLERRIDAMTNRTWKIRSILIASVAAVGLTLASCEAPRPEPLAPGTEKQSSTPALAEGTDYLEFQVEKPASPSPDSPNPRYPEILRQAGVEGEVLVSFVVDETGRADPASFKVIKSTHELFATAVRKVLPDLQFTAAEVGGKKVRQVVQAPFSFTLVGNKVVAGKVQEIERPIIVRRRSDALAATPPHVVILSFDGTELAKGSGETFFKQIAPETIHSIEVFKGNACAPYECPLIKIRLANGRTLGPSSIRVPRDKSYEPERELPVRRIESQVSSKMTVELLDSRGTLVRRWDYRPGPGTINSEDISASEARSGKDCWAGAVCPLTRIWLKPGREAAYVRK